MHIFCEKAHKKELCYLISIMKAHFGEIMCNTPFSITTETDIITSQKNFKIELSLYMKSSSDIIFLFGDNI